MKSITVYKVASIGTEVGIYSNMDQAEIVKTLSGIIFSSVSKIELITTGELSTDTLCTHVNDETGAFYITNENLDKICDLQVLVDMDSECDEWDTVDVTSHEINYYDYTIKLNGINVKEINLTDRLQRDITSEVISWIARVNRKNGF